MVRDKLRIAKAYAEENRKQRRKRYLIQHSAGNYGKSCKHQSLQDFFFNKLTRGAWQRLIRKFIYKINNIYGISALKVYN